MAQTTAHPGPRQLAGLAPASHLGLATTLGSKVEASPPRPSFPRLQLRQGEEVARAAGAGPGRACTWTHVSSALSHTRAGWHVQSQSHCGPSPGRGTRAPVKAGTHLHTLTDTSVCVL